MNATTPTETDEGTLIVVTFEGNESDADLALFASSMIIAAVVDPGRLFVAVFDGFNDDPRGLWEIPEAVARIKRLVDTGIFALFSEPLPDELDGFFGSLRLFAAANGIVNGTPLSRERWNYELACGEARLKAFLSAHALARRSRCGDEPG